MNLRKQKTIHETPESVLAEYNEDLTLENSVLVPSSKDADPLIRTEENNLVTEILGELKPTYQEIIIMAGPCSVEKEDLLIDIAKGVKKAGAK